MTTAGSFEEFINARSPQDGKILIALRYYVSEVVDDKVPTEMLEEMESMAGDRDAFERARASFSSDSEAQVSAALAFLASRWDDPTERARIEHAFDAVSTRLPIVESGLIAIVGMYALFLARTNGVKIEKTVYRRKHDGSIERETSKEMFSPMEPIRAVLALFGRDKGAKVE